MGTSESSCLNGYKEYKYAAHEKGLKKQTPALTPTLFRYIYSVWYYKYTFENTILALNLFRSSALSPSERPVYSFGGDALFLQHFPLMN